MLGTLSDEEVSAYCATVVSERDTSPHFHAPTASLAGLHALGIVEDATYVLWLRPLRHHVMRLVLSQTSLVPCADGAGAANRPWTQSVFRVGGVEMPTEHVFVFQH